MKRQTHILWLAATVVTAGLCLAQFDPWASSRARTPGGGRLVRLEGGAVVDEDALRTARETVPHSVETPNWTNAPGFERDVFTFCRLIFTSDRGRGSSQGFSRQLGWWVDYPDADLNLSYRLQQLTSIRTDPDGRVLRLTDPGLFDHPLIYLEHAGYMRLSDEEVTALRRYLECGGALFVNDFWSDPEWEGFAGQIKRAFPNRAWIELSTDHPLFWCVFDLRGPMHRLRVPTMQFWDTDHDPNDAHSALHRVFRGPGSETMHVRALPDATGRIMILAIHNSDVSDGWEREAEHPRYFSLYSEKIAYPLGVNVIYYLMTH